MSVVEFSYVDMRWRERGWLEVFRLRLAGWIPARQAAYGIKHGVISRTADGRWMTVTKSGFELTQPGTHGLSEENIKFIHCVLELREFQKSWIETPKGQHAVFLKSNDMFDKNYVDAILAPLRMQHNPSRLRSM